LKSGRLYHVANDGAIGLLGFNGASLTDSDEPLDQFPQRCPLTLAIHALQVADPFTEPPFGDLAIRCSQRALTALAVELLESVVTAGTHMAVQARIIWDSDI
jgi:hypothetical protein